MLGAERFESHARHWLTQPLSSGASSSAATISSSWERAASSHVSPSANAYVGRSRGTRAGLGAARRRPRKHGWHAIHLTTSNIAISVAKLYSK